MYREGEASSEPENAARTGARPPANVIVSASLRTDARGLWPRAIRLAYARKSILVNRSIRVRADDFSTGLGSKARPGVAGDRILYEPNAAVSEQGIDAAGVETGGGEGVAAVVALARVALASA